MAILWAKPKILAILDGAKHRKVLLQLRQDLEAFCRVHVTKTYCWLVCPSICWSVMLYFWGVLGQIADISCMPTHTLLMLLCIQPFFPWHPQIWSWVVEANAPMLNPTLIALDFWNNPLVHIKVSLFQHTCVRACAKSAGVYTHAHTGKLYMYILRISFFYFKSSFQISNYHFKFRIPLIERNSMENALFREKRWVWRVCSDDEEENDSIGSACP